MVKTASVSGTGILDRSTNTNAMHDEAALRLQFKFLRKLKRMKELKLRRLHKETFKGTRFYVAIPKWMHRNVIERRLFIYFAVKHYHYNKEHPIAKEFRRQAKHILSKEYVHGIDPMQQAKIALKEQQNFTETNIRAMPITEVDRYLTSLGLFVSGNETLRRRVLWEWFNRPAKELVTHFNDKGQKVKARRTSSVNNKYRLRDLILENPTLGFHDFIDAFGQEMPTVTRASFNNARCILRKAGYDIPTLQSGPSNPAVVTGLYGHIQKARVLNDTTRNV